MKITKAIYRQFSNSEDFIGTMVTTKECEFSTGYFARGRVPMSCILPAGTEVSFSLKAYKDWHNDGNPYVLLTAETWNKFQDETLKVSKTVRLDMTFEDAMNKFNLSRPM